MTDITTANILMTGGAGTLGRAIARIRREERWEGRMTVYSTDTHKHERMRREYPDITCVQGDVRNAETLYLAMSGHDVMIHAGAVKVIPTSEVHSIDTFDVNVTGSLNVCAAALRAGVSHVLGISTDKACLPVNAYGASKMMMEKIFQEYARAGYETQFHLVRLGNVLESTGSVIETWKRMAERGQALPITDPNMTRFFLSPSCAARHCIKAFEFCSGTIYIPILPALSVGRLAEYTVGDALKQMQPIPVRAGEKKHEDILSVEEGWYIERIGGYYLLRSNTGQRNSTPVSPFSSRDAYRLTKAELIQLLEEG
jgi:UDP-N-acetylglucosamine 4,6-dehydratase